MTRLKYIDFRKQLETAMKQHNSCAITLDQSLTDAISRNKDKHIKTHFMLGTYSQKLRKFCFTNQTVSLEEVVNKTTLFEEANEQKGVVEDSKSINEIKNLEKMNNHCKYSLNHYKNKSTN